MNRPNYMKCLLIGLYLSLLQHSFLCIMSQYPIPALAFLDSYSYVHHIVPDFTFNLKLINGFGIK